jgi:ABC-type proline/glycine betaine transport system permease subunit
MVNNNVILTGALPAAILAVAADAGFGWIERRLGAAFGNV